MAYDILSSPDPLALSNENISTHSPTKGRGAVLTPRKALAETSGNTHIQNFYLNTPPPRRTSPTKLPKQRSHSTSPWRIRLTLQAEQINDAQGSPSMKRTPTKRLIERSTTITVPLNGGDDTPEIVQKRGRGRPRKSLEAPVKRSSTPLPKKAARRKTVPYVVEEQDDTHASVRATPPERAKGRPRKSLESAMDIPRSMRADVPLYTPVMEEVERNRAEKATRRKSRARRKEIIPLTIDMETDHESPDSSRKANGSVNEAQSSTADDDMGNSHFGSEDVFALPPDVPQTLDPAIRTRESPSPENSSVEEDPGGMWRAMSSCKTQPPNEDNHGQADFDPTNEHMEYDTILESEGFSMVSVSSLASTGSRSHDSAEEVMEFESQGQKLTASASPVVPPALIDAQIRQQPNQNPWARENTPSVAASPSIPQAPKNAPSQSPRSMQEPTDGTPKLTRVVRAGNALQGVLSPKAHNLGSPFRSAERAHTPITENAAAQTVQGSPVETAKSSKDPSDDLFSGFGAGTRRELKAGLRLGEELAKRQQQNSPKPIPSPFESADVMSSATSAPMYPHLSSADNTADYSLTVPGPVREVQYPVLSNPQLPSPKLSEEDLDEDRMSWRAETPVKIGKPTSADDRNPGQEASHSRHVTSPETSYDGLAAANTSSIDYEMLAREAEYQREREAVSRQIEMANKSQVIVIDDDTSGIRDMSDEDEDGSDVWQAEANKSREPTPEVSQIVDRPEIVKPRRMQLPSPWRRDSQVVYSSEVKPTKADPPCQPDKSKSELATQKKPDSECRPDSSNRPVIEQQRYHVHGSEGKMSRSESSKAQSLEVPAPAESCLTPDRQIDHGPAELPKTPESTYVEDYTESFEEDMSLSPICDKTVNPFPPVDTTAPIDPLLLQKPAQKALQKQPQDPPSPIKPLIQSQQSWLSRLTAPIWRAFTPLPPPATKEDILSSGPYEPLCQFTPWESCHTRALSPLYYASLLYGSHIFPCDKTKDSCIYHGMKIVTPLGWSREVTPADCGVVSAFMVLLDERGFALSEPGERWIDDFIVFHQIVNLWVSMVMKGEVEIDESRGEKSGLRKQGDQKWRREDIDWSKNRKEYFERKRREFDGLPSWKAKVWKYGAA